MIYDSVTGQSLAFTHAAYLSAAADNIGDAVTCLTRIADSLPEPVSQELHGVIPKLGDCLQSVKSALKVSRERV